MAFGNRELTKEDLQKAGLDPDKLKEFQEQGVKKADLDTLKAELSTSMNDSIKAGFAELEGKLSKPAAKSEEGNNNDDGKNKKTIFDIDAVDFSLDPGSHLKNISTALLNDSRVNTMAIRKDNAYERLSQRLKGFKSDAIKAEIDADWDKYTPQVLVNMNADPAILLQKLHDAAIGKHFDEIQTDSAKKDGKFNLVHSGDGGRSSNDNRGSSNDQKKPEDSLSAEELKAAEAFGMTAADYAKEKSEMKYVGA